MNKNTLLLINNENPEDFEGWDIKQITDLLNWRKKYGIQMERKSDCPTNPRQLDSIHANY
jgi:hypothetical protein